MVRCGCLVSHGHLLAFEFFLTRHSLNSGNDHYLFQSAIFWLCLPIAFCLALLPHYAWLAYQFTFNPTDVDIMRVIRKRNPNIDFAHDPEILAGLPEHVRMSAGVQEDELRAPTPLYRHSTDIRGSRTDMSTGLRSRHRGFDFATEEHGVAMQRIQSNLSENKSRGGRFGLGSWKEKRRQRSGSTRLFSLTRSSRKKVPPS